MLAVGLTLSSWGCTETTTPSGSPASVWKGPAQLQEVGRIGAEPGVPGQMLGSIRSVWGTATETYILDDSEPPSVRVYTSAGEYLRSIGRRGEGPGEYRSPLAVAVGPGGNVFVLDSEGDGLVQIYEPTGQYLRTWAYPSTTIYPRPFVVDDSGDIYASTIESVTMPAGHRELQRGFTRIGADGTVYDSVLFETLIPAPYDDWDLVEAGGRIVRRVPFAPRSYWAVGPYELTVTGDSSTNEVSIASRDTPEPAVVTLTGDPVPVDRAEARYFRAALTVSFRRYVPNWVWTEPDIPAFKPAHIGFSVSSDSHVWIWREGLGKPKPNCTIDGPDGESLACWRSPVYADVFTPDGEYLGKVPIPAEIRFPADAFIGGDFLLARVESADGNVQVVRYAIVIPQLEPVSAIALGSPPAWTRKRTTSRAAIIRRGRRICDYAISVTASARQPPVRELRGCNADRESPAPVLSP